MLSNSDNVPISSHCIVSALGCLSSDLMRPDRCSFGLLSSARLKSSLVDQFNTHRIDDLFAATMRLRRGNKRVVISSDEVALVTNKIQGNKATGDGRFLEIGEWMGSRVAFSILLFWYGIYY